MDESERSRITLERIRCPLCGSDRESILFEARDRLHRIPGLFQIVKCVKCPMIYLNPRPTKDSLKLCYPDDYFSHKELGEPDELKLGHRIRDLMLRLYHGYPGSSRSSARPGLGMRIVAAPLYPLFKANRRNALVIPYQGKGKLLDVGCGNGRFLSIMRRGGWKTAGIEADIELAARLRAELGLDIHAGRIENCPFEDSSFDVIHLSHVLEHLADPVASLGKALRLLKTGGRLYLRLPDSNGLAAKLFKDRWVGLDAPRHLCIYTRESVEMLLDKSGFILEEIKQDTNSPGMRRTMLLADDGRLSLISAIAKTKPVMAALRFAVHTLGKGDGMIVRARKG